MATRTTGGNGRLPSVGNNKITPSPRKKTIIQAKSRSADMGEIAYWLSEIGDCLLIGSPPQFLWE
jgi:hypothetical protein